MAQARMSKPAGWAKRLPRGDAQGKSMFMEQTRPPTRRRVAILEHGTPGLFGWP
jgi:hypothetical protein